MGEELDLEEIVSAQKLGQSPAFFLREYKSVPIHKNGYDDSKPQNATALGALNNGIEIIQDGKSIAGTNISDYIFAKPSSNDKPQPVAMEKLTETELATQAKALINKFAECAGANTIGPVLLKDLDNANAKVKASEIAKIMEANPALVLREIQRLDRPLQELLLPELKTALIAELRVDWTPKQWRQELLLHPKKTQLIAEAKMSEAEARSLLPESMTLLKNPFAPKSQMTATLEFVREQRAASEKAVKALEMLAPYWSKTDAEFIIRAMSPTANGNYLKGAAELLSRNVGKFSTEVRACIPELLISAIAKANTELSQQSLSSWGLEQSLSNGRLETLKTLALFAPQLKQNQIKFLAGLAGIENMSDSKTSEPQKSSSLDSAKEELKREAAKILAIVPLTDAVPESLQALLKSISRLRLLPFDRENLSGKEDLYPFAAMIGSKEPPAQASQLKHLMRLVYGDEHVERLQRRCADFMSKVASDLSAPQELRDSAAKTVYENEAQPQLPTWAILDKMLNGSKNLGKAPSADIVQLATDITKNLHGQSSNPYDLLLKTIANIDYVNALPGAIKSRLMGWNQLPDEHKRVMGWVKEPTEPQKTQLAWDKLSDLQRENFRWAKVMVQPQQIIGQMSSGMLLKTDNPNAVLLKDLESAKAGSPLRVCIDQCKEELTNKTALQATKEKIIAVLQNTPFTNFDDPKFRKGLVERLSKPDSLESVEALFQGIKDRYDQIYLGTNGLNSFDKYQEHLELRKRAAENRIDPIHPGKIVFNIVEKELKLLERHKKQLDNVGSSFNLSFTLARDLCAYRAKCLSGDKLGAQKLAFEHLSTYGPNVLQVCAPSLWRDLYSSCQEIAGGKSIAASAFERGDALCRNLPDYSSEPLGFKQALGLAPISGDQALGLAQLVKDKYDYQVLKSLCIARIDDDKFLRQTKLRFYNLEKSLKDLQFAVSGVQGGNESAEPNDMHKFAADVKAALKKVDAPQLKETIGLMELVAKKQDAPAELLDRIKSYKSIYNMCRGDAAPYEGEGIQGAEAAKCIKDLVDAVEQGRIQKPSVLSWFKQNIVTIIGVAAAVAVASGVGAPVGIGMLALEGVIVTGVGISTTELVEYGLYKANQQSYSGWGDPFSKGPLLTQLLNKHQVESLDDLLKPEVAKEMSEKLGWHYTKEMAIGFASFTTGCLAAKIGGAASSKVVRQFKILPPPNSVSLGMKTAQAESLAGLGGNLGKFMKSGLGRVGIKFLNNCGFSLAQSAGEEAVKTSTGLNNEALAQAGEAAQRELSFGVSIGLAFLQGAKRGKLLNDAKTKPGKPGDPVTVEFELAQQIKPEQFIEHMKEQGFAVRETSKKGLWEIRPLGAGPEMPPMFLENAARLKQSSDAVARPEPTLEQQNQFKKNFPDLSGDRLFELNRKIEILRSSWTEDLSQLPLSKQAEMIEARRAQLEKELRQFSGNALQTVEVVPEIPGRDAEYSFGKGKLIIPQEAISSPLGNEGLNKIVRHELVHAFQNKLIIEACLKETAGNIIEAQKLYEQLTKRQLSQDLAESMKAENTYDRLSASEQARARKLAESVANYNGQAAGKQVIALIETEAYLAEHDSLLGLSKVPSSVSSVQTIKLEALPSNPAPEDIRKVAPPTAAEIVAFKRNLLDNGASKTALASLSESTYKRLYETIMTADPLVRKCFLDPILAEGVREPGTNWQYQNVKFGRVFTSELIRTMDMIAQFKGRNPLAQLEALQKTGQLGMEAPDSVSASKLAQAILSGLPGADYESLARELIFGSGANSHDVQKTLANYASERAKTSPLPEAVRWNELSQALSRADAFGRVLADLIAGKSLELQSVSRLINTMAAEELAKIRNPQNLAILLEAANRQAAGRYLGPKAIEALLSAAESANNSPVKGIANFNQVEPGLFRGGAPKSADAVAELAGRGVKTVINLEFLCESGVGTAKQTERNDWYKNNGIKQIGWEQICGSDLPIPYHMSDLTPQHMQRLLAVMSSAYAEAPLLVHCTRGIDRSGAAIANWRISRQGWTPEQAAAEMLDFGFNLSTPGAKIIPSLIGQGGVPEAVMTGAAARNNRPPLVPSPGVMPKEVVEQWAKLANYAEKPQEARWNLLKSVQSETLNALPRMQLAEMVNSLTQSRLESLRPSERTAVITKCLNALEGNTKIDALTRLSLQEKIVTALDASSLDIVNSLQPKQQKLLGEAVVNIIGAKSGVQAASDAIHHVGRITQRLHPNVIDRAMVDRLLNGLSSTEKDAALANLRKRKSFLSEDGLRPVFQEMLGNLQRAGAVSLTRDQYGRTYQKISAVINTQEGAAAAYLFRKLTGVEVECYFAGEKLPKGAKPVCFDNQEQLGASGQKQSDKNSSSLICPAQILEFHSGANLIDLALSRIKPDAIAQLRVRLGLPTAGAAVKVAPETKISDKEYESLKQEIEAPVNAIRDLAIMRALLRTAKIEQGLEELRVIDLTTQVVSNMRMMIEAGNLYKRLFPTATTAEPMPNDTLMVSGSKHESIERKIDSKALSMLQFRVANGLIDPAFDKQFLTDAQFRKMLAKPDALKGISKIVIPNDLIGTGEEAWASIDNMRRQLAKAGRPDIQIVYGAFVGTERGLTEVRYRVGEFKNVSLIVGRSLDRLPKPLGEAELPYCDYTDDLLRVLSAAPALVADKAIDRFTKPMFQSDNQSGAGGDQVTGVVLQHLFPNSTPQRIAEMMKALLVPGAHSKELLSAAKKDKTVSADKSQIDE